MRYNRDLLLVTDGDSLNRGWFTPLKEHHWHPTHVDGIQAAEEAIKARAPAVILLNCGNKPSSEVKELFYFCLTRGEGAAVVPILSEGTVEEVLGYIRTGASDVLISPFDKRELISVVERAADTKRLVLERSRYRDQLEKTNRELQESLRVLRQDQVAGRQVQRSMLPKSPQRFGEYTIAHQIIPSLYLSGDFVGYHVVFDRYLTFYFADVSGHGASSAFVTVLLRFMLNRIIHRHSLLQDHANMAKAPKGFAESLNRQILATGLDKHLTLFAGSIDMQEHKMRYVIGSQMPAPIFKTPHGARFLEGKGKPIGLFEGAEWDVHEIDLPEQFSLALVSDGMFDFISGDTLIDKEQWLFETIANSEHSLRSICDNLGISNIDEAPDDISLLFVSRGV